jgi:hypothetical protein
MQVANAATLTPVTHRPRTLDLVCDPPTLPPSVRLTPATGQPGSSVTARLLYFIPSEDVQMIFRGPGNPIVARGRTDTDGAASLQFVVPQYISGVYDVFTVNVADPNCDAVVQFTVIPGPPATATPTQAPPTPTPTRPVNATPTLPAAPTATSAPPSPTPTATPAIAIVVAPPMVPQAGRGPTGNRDGMASPAAGLFILGGLVLAFAGLGIMRELSRRR